MKVALAAVQGDRTLAQLAERCDVHPHRITQGKVQLPIEYEAVNLHACDSVSAARAGIGRYISFYNERRPHRSLDGATPESVDFNSLPLPLAA